MAEAVRRRPPPKLPRAGLRQWDPDPWRRRVLLALVALLALAGATWFFSNYDPWPNLGSDNEVHFAQPVGPRLTDPACVFTLVDESSSMVDADRSGVRAAAVSETQRLLGEFGLTGDEYGAGWFADTQAYTDPRPASAASVPSRAPQVGGSTQMAQAIDAVDLSMDRSCSQRRVLLLVTDGVADDFDAVSHQLLDLGKDTEVHLIAINVNGAYESARAFWEDPRHGVDSIREVQTVNATTIAGATAEVLELITAQRIRTG